MHVLVGSIPMILRRVYGHIRAQNWFAVLIEFLLVILGVFIGIEVANWNEARQERGEERRYYQQIRADLADDLQTFQTAQDRSHANDRQAQLALAAMEERPPNVPAARVAISLHRAGFLYIPRLSRGTYDELISTGNLGLLRDHELKAKIVRYYDRFDEHRQWDAMLRAYNSEYNKASAGVLPRTVLQASIRGATPEVSEAQLKAILAEANERDDLRGLIIGMAAHQERVRRDSERAEQRARDLIADVDWRLASD